MDSTLVLFCPIQFELSRDKLKTFTFWGPLFKTESPIKYDEWDLPIFIPKDSVNRFLGRMEETTPIHLQMNVEGGGFLFNMTADITRFFCAPGVKRDSGGLIFNLPYDSVPTQDDFCLVWGEASVEQSHWSPGLARQWQLELTFQVVKTQGFISSHESPLYFVELQQILNGRIAALEEE
jgi:hypothetical protein